MKYDEVVARLDSMSRWDRKIKRTDRDCERTELLKLLKRQEKLGTEVGCLNRRNLVDTALADSWTQNLLIEKISLIEVSQTAILLLARMTDIESQNYAIDLLKRVIEKDTDPYSFKQLNKFGVSLKVMKYIIALAKSKAGKR